MESSSSSDGSAPPPLSDFLNINAFTLHFSSFYAAKTCGKRFEEMENRASFSAGETDYVSVPKSTWHADTTAYKGLDIIAVRFAI